MTIQEGIDFEISLSKIKMANPILNFMSIKFQSIETKIKGDKPLNILLILGVITALALAILIFIPKTKQEALKGLLPSTSQPPGIKLQEYKFANLTINIGTERNIAEIINSFFQNTLKPDLLPKEISFQLTEKAKEGRGDGHTGRWNKDGKYLSVLYGASTDPKKPAYFRIWFMPPGEDTNKLQATTLLHEVFSDKFLNDLGEINCQKSMSTQEKAEVTECAKMKTLDNGNLIGVTVRAPITLDQAPPGITPTTNTSKVKVTIVSACLIPKEGTQYYSHSACI